MPKSISSNQLTPNSIYLVRGKVGFSRITRQTTDQERELENKRRMYPQTTNYSNITIYEAQVLAKDPQNPTIEEKYALECLYKSSSGKYPGNNFSAMNKSKNLPEVMILRANNEYETIVPEYELAQGLDVTLVMRVFKSSGQRNNGVSLDRILVNETQMRYYRNDLNDELAKYGITTYSHVSPDTQTADGLNTAAAEAAAAATNEEPPAFGNALAGANAAAGATPVEATPNQGYTMTPPPEAAPNATPFSSYNSAPANMIGAGAGRQY